MHRNVWLYGLAIALTLSSCRRDEDVDPSTPAVPVDGRDKFVGDYLVYDTLGTYLYRLSVSKFGTGGRDSLMLENFADTFDLRILHEDYWTGSYLHIFPGFGVKDRAGNSWALWGAPGDEGANTLLGDTIRLGFTQSNIAFYWQEGVPYYSCVCKQIAVKQ